MSFFDLPGDESSPQLSRLIKKYRDEVRAPPNVIAAMKLAPKTMRSVLQLNNAVTFGGSVLGRKREELVAVATSAINACFY